MKSVLLTALVALACSAAAAEFDDWFLEDEEHAGQFGTWLDGLPYEDGFMALSGENLFVPSGGPSQGDLVTVRMTLCFDDAVPEDHAPGSQAALRLNGDRFQVLTSDGASPVWLDVSADGVAAEVARVYEIAFTVDFDAGDYGVTVVNEGRSVDFSANGLLRFPLAESATNVVSAVSFRGFGGISRLEGETADLRAATQVAVASLEPEFGTDFGTLDVRVTLDLGASPPEDGLVWTLASGANVVTGTCDCAFGVVTFTGLAVRRSEVNTCRVKAVGADGIHCWQTFSVRSGRVSGTWICEDEEHAGETGSWRARQPYEDGRITVAGTDGFVPSAGRSDGNRVTVRATARFDEPLPVEPEEGAQLALRLNGERFQVLAGTPPKWLDVAAAGVRAECGRDYEFVFELDYADGTYGVGVVDGERIVPLKADGVARFPLTKAATNGASEVHFDGEGSVTSIYGEYVDASVARTDGVRYDTLEDALGSGRPVTVTWPKAVSGNALANAARGSDITLTGVTAPMSVCLAPGVTVHLAADQLPGLLTFLSPVTWFDVVARDGAMALALNATATPQIGPTDNGPALTFDGQTLRLSVTNAKPGLSYALSSVTDLTKPFNPPTKGWQRFDGDVEGPTTLSTETDEPAAFFKVFVSDR